MTAFLIAVAIAIGWYFLVKCFAGIASFSNVDGVGGLADWVIIQSHIDRLIELTEPSDNEADYPPDEAGQWRQIKDDVKSYVSGKHSEAINLAEWLEDKGVVEINDIGDVRILTDRSTRT